MMSNTRTRSNGALGLPCTLSLGRYQGGEGLRILPLFFSAPIDAGVVEVEGGERFNIDGPTSSSVPPLASTPFDSLKDSMGLLVDERDALFSAANRALIEYNKNPLGILPDYPHSIPHADSVQWELSFIVSPLLEEGEQHHHNLFFQGWLFEDEVKEEGRLGVQGLPLIGLFDSSPSLSESLKSINPNMLHQYAAIDSFSIQDQHAHFVEEYLELDEQVITLGEWHIGSDSARVVFDPSEPIHCFEVCCVDPVKLRGLKVFAVVVSHEVEKQLKPLIHDPKSLLSSLVQLLISSQTESLGTHPLYAQIIHLLQAQTTLQ